MASIPTHDRITAFGRYIALNSAVVMVAGFLAGQLAGLAAELRPFIEGPEPAQPSRVEKFKMAEAAARDPRHPVPRTVVAFEQPELPVQVLAVRIDDAEDVKVKPMRLKAKPQRYAKVARTKKAAVRNQAELLPILVINDVPVTGPPPGRHLRGKVAAESARDITNRTLGVLVAMKD
ncbi:MAG: hypothetical protein MUC37_09110 [Hyphomicrobium sp.]|jgi:hypothetical protein|nr:hypothetical protein [Hyphomicrobium sp.]